MSQLLASLLLLASVTNEPFAFRENDRVVFLGGGFVENDRSQGYFEASLQRRYPNLNLTFRSLGWSGDTVRGIARTAGFQSPDGLARLEKDLKALKPTVIFLAYGMNESFAGPETLPSFLKDYGSLLEKLKPLNARLVLLTPTYHEDRGRPFPDPTEHNQTLDRMVYGLERLAEQHRATLVDLFHPLEAAKKARPGENLTTNGILLTARGYALAGEATELALGQSPAKWFVEATADGKITKTEGVQVSNVQPTPTGLRFTAAETVLPAGFGGNTPVPRLRVKGLPPGIYSLRIDGQPSGRGAAEEWAEGVAIAVSPMQSDAEKLRAAVVERSELFYRRWRPYNDHSRHWGFIGGDYKLYDDEISAVEKRIATLRQPKSRVVEVVFTQKDK